ncbi:MAG: acyl-ACP--UDP-N-acetylglucosamine O-acyltransferase [Nitrospinae bacterium]|nr:acyl-ACP--UDP-N-acetylglucosamine O-acyltransferase [Nitrospinota bacterium]
MAAQIHPTAIVDPNAIIGDGCQIGPFSIIGPNVTLGANCVVGPRVSMDWTRMGANCHVGANTIVGGNPQIYNWKNVPSWVETGDNVFINELTAIHRSMYENGATVIGEGCYVMTQTHMGHDCKLGKGVTVTTLAGLSGHVEVGDYAVIGGAAGIHQFVRIGSMAMVGGMSRIVQDVPPYFIVAGVPCRARGINVIGMRRRGVSRDERNAVKKAFHILNSPSLLLPDAVAKVETDIAQDGAVKELIEFAKTTKRGLTLARKGGGEEEEI